MSREIDVVFGIKKNKNKPTDEANEKKAESFIFIRFAIIREGKGEFWGAGSKRIGGLNS